MKIKTILMALLFLGCFIPANAQSDVGIEGLQVLVGEWETTFPQSDTLLEKGKWILEPILEGRGLNFKSFVMLKGNSPNWTPGGELFMGGTKESENVLGTAILYFEGAAMHFKGSYLNNVLRLVMSGDINNIPYNGTLTIKLLSENEATMEFEETFGDEPISSEEPTKFVRIK